MVHAGVQTRTSVHVAAKSYVFLSNEISRIFYESIQSAGLDPTAYAMQQPTIEAGLRTWLTMRQLEAAHLEIIEAGSQRVRSRIDLGVSYVDNSSEDRFATDIDRVKQALAGTERMDGCVYRIVVTLKDGAAAVAGWGSTNLGSVDHLTRDDVGQVIDAPAASARMTRYF